MKQIKLNKAQLEATEPKFIEDCGYQTYCPICYNNYYLSLKETNDLITKGETQIHCLNCRQTEKIKIVN